LRILVIGGGGREHALVWQLARFHHELFCIPGNAGIAQLAQCSPAGLEDVPGLVRFARDQHIDLTIVGPEAPLVAGIADEFKRQGLRLFGPDAAGARLEGDKSFAKSLMRRQGIPTAEFEAFTSLDRARACLKARRLPVVIKASGLAAGKGVVVAGTLAEAEQAVSEMLSGSRFGAAGRTVVIEEFLEGEEASIIGLCDGSSFSYMAPSQDHKRLRDGDQGPNTGGMGAYAPAPAVTREVQHQVEERVFKPLLAGLRKAGIDYRGVVYAGIMVTDQGPKVLEFNCRFGDPETQALMPLLGTDLAELALACIEGRLAAVRPEWSSRSALCIVAAAQGYPESYRRGDEITLDLPDSDDVAVFHAGTKLAGDKVVTNGGRVLGVTGVGDTLKVARDRAYQAIGQISYSGMFYRRDIGARGLKAASV
jgi:phosphoribosylamine--glycine ligase